MMERMNWKRRLAAMITAVMMLTSYAPVSPADEPTELPVAEAVVQVPVTESVPTAPAAAPEAAAADQPAEPAAAPVTPAEALPDSGTDSGTPAASEPLAQEAPVDVQPDSSEKAEEAPVTVEQTEVSPVAEPAVQDEPADAADAVAADAADEPSEAVDAQSGEDDVVPPAADDAAAPAEESAPAEEPAVSISRTGSLANLLVGVKLTGFAERDRTWYAEADTEYTLSLRFADSMTTRLSNGAWTYQLPGGFHVTDQRKAAVASEPYVRGQVSVSVNDGEKKISVPANYTVTASGLVTVTLEGYTLTDADMAGFSLNVRGTIAAGTYDFGKGIKRTVTRDTAPAEAADETAAPAEAADETAAPVETTNEPEAPAETTDELEVPAETTDESEALVETVDAPEAPAETVDAPEAPVETTDEPEAPVETVDAPEAPVETTDEPEAPAETTDAPAAPVEAADEPAAPVETTDEPAAEAPAAARSDALAGFVTGVSISNAELIDGMLTVADDTVCGVTLRVSDGETKLARGAWTLQLPEGFTPAAAEGTLALTVADGETAADVSAAYTLTDSGLLTVIPEDTAALTDTAVTSFRLKVEGTFAATGEYRFGGVSVTVAVAAPADDEAALPEEEIPADATATDIEADESAEEAPADETAEVLTGSVSASADGLSVTVDVPEAAGIPADAQLKVGIVTGGDYIARAEHFLRGGIVEAYVFNIGFYGADGTEYEPAAPVGVQVTLPGLLSGDTAKHLLHFTGDRVEELGVSVNGTAPAVKNAVRGPKKVYNGAPAVTTLSFTAGGFSVYAVVGEEEIEEESRATVTFYDVNGTAVATVYVKNSDTPEEMREIVYDPGCGTVPDNQLFRGWILDNGDNDTNSAAGQVEYDTSTPYMTIADVRNELAGITIEEGMELNYYPMIFNVYHITYTGEAAGVIIESKTEVTTNTVPNITHTIATDYTPATSTQAFMGWLVSEGINNVVSAVDDEGNSLEVSATTTYPLGTVLTIKGDVSLSVDAPQGHWVVFEENGKNATYIAPQFVREGQTTVEPSIEMQRVGYTFDGWYTNAECTGDEYVFGGQLDDNVTLYAKWIEAETARYTIVVWQERMTDTYAGNVESGSRNYDFYASYAMEGTVGDTINAVTRNGANVTDADGTYRNARVSGTDADGNTVNEEIAITGHHLSSYTTGIRVTPEGNAVVDVYYDRNTVTYTFRTVQYTRTTADYNTQPEQYGIIHGEYIRLTRNDNRWKYYALTTGYDEPQYALINGEYYEL